MRGVLLLALAWAMGCGGAEGAPDAADAGHDAPPPPVQCDAGPPPPPGSIAVRVDGEPERVYAGPTSCSYSYRSPREAWCPVPGTSFELQLEFYEPVTHPAPGTVWRMGREIRRMAVVTERDERGARLHGVEVLPGSPVTIENHGQGPVLRGVGCQEQPRAGSIVPNEFALGRFEEL